MSESEFVGGRRGIRVLRPPGMFTIPDRAANVTVTSGGGAGTLGTWTQLTAGMPWDILIHGFTFGVHSTPAADNSYYALHLGIGEGTGGIFGIGYFKIWSLDFTTAAGRTWTSAPQWLPYPLWIPSNTRIAAQTYGNVASIFTTVGLNCSRVIDEDVI